MQRSQRDTQRRNDFSQFSASMTSYMTNNNGSLPKKFTNISENTEDAKNSDAAKYVNSTGKDPNGFVYQLYAGACKKQHWRQRHRYLSQIFPRLRCLWRPRIRQRYLLLRFQLESFLKILTANKNSPKHDGEFHLAVWVKLEGL